MNLRKCLQALVVLLSTGHGLPARAETASEVMNGATCIPYPPYDTTVAVPYQHWLYAFRESAFCHITMPPSWSVDNLSYVLFQGTGALTARLCVHSGTFTVTCGAPRTISGGTSIQWVGPPMLPSFASGAFVHIQIPSRSTATVQQLWPVWSR
jgi:hypothetical protein